MTDRDRLRPPLDERSLRDQLIGAGSGWRQLDVVAQTGSTNADLLARAASGADIDGVVLIAEHQTAGRGRHGRGWAATARAQIILSVGVRVVDVPVQAWGWLSLAAGLAVLDSVAPLIAVPPAETGLKWPNDVLARGGKLAGILAEVAQPFVVLGVGLNVTQAPEEVDPDATSLLDLGVAAPDRNRIASRLLRELEARIIQWRNANPQLAADYRARSLTIGSRVRVELPGGQDVVGIARDIDDQGRLCLDVGGRTGGVSAGDVVHLR
ncbi:bifunctional protein BirA: biotin operon repressor + biotin--[acetyl-CoA-carboxylase] synthetase [Mycobacterium tuberculosis]|nr:biotin--[acetyl-CoA-carboxylase] ligase [Mycobacterium tuberculosis]CKN77972.1 bifunctional protein BirA: biotin operon repressor + biotin--[acetyl-CoA-carboxylase] synthetase [Mycobacterium tuberculosis]